MPSHWAPSRKQKNIMKIYSLFAVRVHSTRLGSIANATDHEKKRMKTLLFFHHLASSDNQINHIIIMFIEQQ